MKTYCEEKGNQPVNWRKELSAKKIDWERLVPLAESWQTCSCGMLFYQIERDHDGNPKNDLLESLGMEFTKAVRGHNKEYAIHYLNLVEAHAKILIGEIKETLKEQISVLKMKMEECG